MSKYIRVWRASTNPRADIVWIVIDENNSQSIHTLTDSTQGLSSGQ